MSDVKETKERMDNFEFVTLWNSEKSLEEIAKEKGMNAQSLKVRANAIRKKVSEQQAKLTARLTEEKAKSTPDNKTITLINGQLTQLGMITLRERKGTSGRKTGLDALLALAGQVKGK